MLVTLGFKSTAHTKEKKQGLFVRIITIDTIIITNIIIVIFTVIFMQSKIRMK